MTVFLVIIHVIVCVALIMIVLLQTGKGADIGAAFGGGSSNTLFGTSGASTFLSKATTVAAVVFMLTSLSLAYLASHRTGSSIVTETPAVETPAPQAGAAPAAVPQPAPAPGAAETKPETPAKQ
jgi:preprotein translocase subunit SecG